MTVAIGGLVVAILCLLVSNRWLRDDLAYERKEGEHQRDRADKNACVGREWERKAHEAEWEKKVIHEKLCATEELLRKLDEYHRSTLPKL